jgi:hypothetical protein
MSHLVDICDVAPRRRSSQRTTSLSTRQAKHAYRTYSASAPLRYGPYRKTGRDLSFIRVVAASAIVMGLLLGVGPTALAQVGRLLASVPALFTQGIPTPGAFGTDTSDVMNDTAPTDAGVQHP